MFVNKIVFIHLRQYYYDSNTIHAKQVRLINHEVFYGEVLTIKSEPENPGSPDHAFSFVCFVVMDAYKSFIFIPSSLCRKTRSAFFSWLSQQLDSQLIWHSFKNTKTKKTSKSTLNAIVSKSVNELNMPPDKSVALLWKFSCETLF